MSEDNGPRPKTRGELTSATAALPCQIVGGCIKLLGQSAQVVGNIGGGCRQFP